MVEAVQMVEVFEGLMLLLLLMMLLVLSLPRYRMTNGRSGVTKIIIGGAREGRGSSMASASGLGLTNADASRFPAASMRQGYQHLTASHIATHSRLLFHHPSIHFLFTRPSSPLSVTPVAGDGRDSQTPTPTPVSE